MPKCLASPIPTASLIINSTAPNSPCSSKSVEFKIARSSDLCLQNVSNSSINQSSCLASMSFKLCSSNPVVAIICSLEGSAP